MNIRKLAYTLSVLTLAFSLNANAYNFKAMERPSEFVKVKSIDEIIVKDLTSGKNVELSLDCVDENELYEDVRSKRKEAIATLTRILKSSQITVFIDPREEHEYYESFDRDVEGVVVLKDKNTTLNEEVVKLGYAFFDHEDIREEPICREFNIGNR